MPSIKDILIQGGKERKVLELTYKKKDGSVVKRKVEPYELRGETFWGWDVAAEHIKKFIIWNIRDAKVTKDEFDSRYPIKMSKAGGVTVNSSLEITFNAMMGVLNEERIDFRELKEITEALGKQLSDATSTLRKELKKDPELYRAYQANIAMQFYDEAKRKDSRDGRTTTHEIANEAAKNFLDLFISEPGAKEEAAEGNDSAIDLNNLPNDVYELPDTAGITRVGEALTRQIHGSVYRMRRIEHKRFGTVYAVWYRTYQPAYFSPKDGFVHSGSDTQLTGEVKKKTEWLVALYNKIYKDGVRAGSE